MIRHTLLQLAGARAIAGRLRASPGSGPHVQVLEEIASDALDNALLIYPRESPVRQSAVAFVTAMLKGQPPKAADLRTLQESDR